MKRRTMLRTGTAVAVGSTVAGCLSSLRSNSSKTVTVVDFPVSRMPYFYYPMEKGLFEERDLDLELTDEPVFGGSRVLSTVLSGKADIATSVANSGALNLAREQDKFMKVLYPSLQVDFENGYSGGTSLILNESYDSIADLAGEEIAVAAGESGILTGSARWAVDEAGLDPYNDVSIKYVPLPEIAGTVGRGEVAAGILLEPRVVAAEREGVGITREKLVYEWAGAAPITGHLVLPGFVEEHPDTVERIQDALSETNQMVRENPGDFLEFSAEKLDIDKGLLEEMWDQGYYGQTIVEYDRSDIIDGIEATQDLLVEYTDTDSRVDASKFLID